MTQPETAERPRAAVVGSGIAGLTAAYILQQHYDVTLFEAQDRLGGHAHTHDIATPDGRSTSIDTGFIVHNDRTYPRLLRLFAELGVATRDTEMSMSVQCLGCGLEYAGARGARGLFPRGRNLARRRYLRMLTEIPRFHRQATRLLAEPDDRQTTLASFLSAGGYSRYFVDHFALPLVSTVWSTGAELAGQYPARYLFGFLAQHGLLGIGGSPQWRTVLGGSREYVTRAVKHLTAVQLATPVRAVRRHGGAQPAGPAGSVEIRDDADHAHHVDRVVLATHPDQALALLVDPTPLERAVLGAIPYSTNAAVLHTDACVLPRTAGARASWNHSKAACAAAPGPVQVSYDMNRLMGLRESADYVVTLNGADRVDPQQVLRTMLYQHPAYTPQSLHAQQRLPELTGGLTAYAGAYHGWGFHEDGCASGVRAAAALGVGW